MKWPDRMDLWDQFEEVYQNEGKDAAMAFYAPRRADMDVRWSTGRPSSRSSG